MRIWDTFLYEGSKVLFRYAIAIFFYNQDALLEENNSIAIFNKLRSMCKEATDVKRLTEVSWEAVFLQPLHLSSVSLSPFFLEYTIVQMKPPFDYP